MTASATSTLACALAALAACGFTGKASTTDGGLFEDAAADAAPPETLVLRRDLGATVLDTWLFEAKPAEDRGTFEDFGWDERRSEAGNFNGESAALLQFDFIGDGADQVPSGSEIDSATLRLYLLDGGDAADLFDMVVSWDESTTWDTLGDAPGPVAGSDYDDTAVATTPVTVDPPGDIEVVVDVTAGIAAWVDGTRPNLGWLLRTVGMNGVRVASSDDPDADLTRHPTLTIVFRRP